MNIKILSLTAHVRKALCCDGSVMSLCLRKAIGGISCLILDQPDEDLRIRLCCSVLYMRHLLSWQREPPLWLFLRDLPSFFPCKKWQYIACFSYGQRMLFTVQTVKPNEEMGF